MTIPGTSTREPNLTDNEADRLYRAHHLAWLITQRDLYGRDSEVGQLFEAELDAATKTFTKLYPMEDA